MKTGTFLIFLSVVLSIYTAVNSYILWRGWQGLAGTGWIRLVVFAVFLIWVLLYPAGRILEKTGVCPLSDFCIHAGSVWLGYMLYLLLLILSVDSVRIADRFLHFIPAGLFTPGGSGRLILSIVIFLSATAVVIQGYSNAVNTVYREETVRISRPGLITQKKHFRIAVASDIHLGTIISNSHVDRLVSMINAKEPDLILLPGDVIDEDLKPVIDMNLGESLRKLKAVHGVFAVNGNHEHIGGAEAAVRYLEEHGIRVLRDEFVVVADSIVIAGREDLASDRFSGRKRKSLSELLAPVPREKPIILMDHQPFHPDEARKLGVDLQLSGHTHRGQMWPLNFLTSRIFETDWGVTRKDGSVLIVSSGFGTWGPPVRTGSQSEIWIIDLEISGPPLH